MQTVNQGIQAARRLRATLKLRVQLSKVVLDSGVRSPRLQAPPVPQASVATTPAVSGADLLAGGVR